MSERKSSPRSPRSPRKETKSPRSPGRKTSAKGRKSASQERKSPRRAIRRKSVPRLVTERVKSLLEEIPSTSTKKEILERTAMILREMPVRVSQDKSGWRSVITIAAAGRGNTLYLEKTDEKEWTEIHIGTRKSNLSRRIFTSVTSILDIYRQPGVVIDFVEVEVMNGTEVMDSVVYSRTGSDKRLIERRLKKPIS